MKKLLPKKPINALSNKDLAYITSITIAALLIKSGGFDYFPGKYLWADDGNIFLTEAQYLGASSIFKPYGGYLHLYPRLIAYLSTSVDLVNRPIILLLGWLFAYFLMVYLFALSAKKCGLQWFSTTALIFLVTLQPNDGEIFLILQIHNGFLAQHLRYWY